MKFIKQKGYKKMSQDIFHRKTKPNELILGKAGAGKSFNLNTEKMSSSILLEYQNKANIYCDPKNEVLIDEQ